MHLEEDVVVVVRLSPHPDPFERESDLGLGWLAVIHFEGEISEKVTRRARFERELKPEPGPPGHKVAHRLDQLATV